MKTSFRQDAKKSLERAKDELLTQNQDRLCYAALELRLAMEALTYDRAEAYKAEIPPDEYGTWQPRKLMQSLLDIAPDADKGSTISFGPEEECGKPPATMQSLGTEKVFDLAALKEHYDALGSYLHMPTLKQLEKAMPVDYAKLRTRCGLIVVGIEAALASPVWNITLGSFATIECLRCSKPVRRRLSFAKDSKPVNATCFECGAPYLVKEGGPGKSEWVPLRDEIPCPTPACKGKHSLWLDQRTDGTSWHCGECEGEFQIGLAVLKKGKIAVHK